MSDRLEPIWQPSADRIQQSNLTAFVERVSRRYCRDFRTYAELHAWSIEHPEQFWQAIWEFSEIIASIPAQQVLSRGNTFAETAWFPDACLNFAENLLRRRDDKTALVSFTEDGICRTLTYSQLYQQVAELATSLRESGITTGDRVAGFLPNIRETVVAMLATASIGAIWSSCSPDFGINGLSDRFGQIEPRLLFAADGYEYKGKKLDCLERVRQLQSQLPSLEKIVIVPFLDAAPNLRGLDKVVLYEDFLQKEASEIVFEQLPFNHPLCIVYSSGTTGMPKCIVHGAGGTLLQHSKELRLHTDLQPDDTIFYFTTCGWMMWNWLVSSLSVGATVILYEGSPFHPSPERLFNLIDAEKISIFGTSARYLAAVEKAGVKPRLTHQLSYLKTLLSTGSPLVPANYEYVYRDVKNDVCLSSISGGTDILSCFALGNPTLPVYVGELQCLGLGMAVDVFDEVGNPCVGKKGELVCKQPFPCCPLGFWNDPQGEKFYRAYFAKFDNIWTHGDYAEISDRLTHRGLIIYGRSDTVLNPGGVRIGTAEIYRQVEQFEEILESLAVGQHWQDDERIILFVILKADKILDETLIKHLKTQIRENTTPRHVPAKIIAVPDLPRTLNGKLVELAVRRLIHDEPVSNTDALANPEALDYFKNLAELNC